MAANLHARGARRWWLVVAVLLATAAALAAVIGLRSTRSGQPQAAPPLVAPQPLGLPKQLLLSTPMREQPVIGWRVTASELGLPAGTVFRPVGNVADRGYFLGITDEGWWIVGLEVTNGRRLFAPVWLGRSEQALDFNCFVNGPTMLLCIRSGGDAPRRAWVVNTENGSLVFDGATDLQLESAENQHKVMQVGDHVVVAVVGEGVHGVGPHAELTWFVPGSGLLDQPVEWPSDLGPSTLAAQQGFEGPDVILSVVDGTVVTPSTRAGSEVGDAVVYPGGFGYSYREPGDNQDQVEFFDQSGRALSNSPLTGLLLRTSSDVPIVETESQLDVHALDGRRLLEIPKPVLQPYARLIGTSLFVTSDERQRSWQQYDLRTGTMGRTCDIEDLGYGYIASDGAVALLAGRRTPAHAIDLTTCDELWSLPGYPDGTVQEVWRVNTMLLGRADDELFALVPAS